MSTTPPELGPFVTAAREQAIITTNVTADAVMAGLEQHQRRTQARRTLTLSAVIALAASLVGVSLLGPMLPARDTQPTHAAAGDGFGDGSEHAAGRANTLTPAHEAPQPNHIASAISLRTNTTVEVRGPWSIALDEGVHELEVEATPGRALRVSLPERELELVQGSAAVRLHNGVAAWVSEDGERSVLNVEHVEIHAPTTPPGNTRATATQLAREAELLLAAGKPDKAATVLRQLISAYPKASQTRSALLDLARLLRNSNQQDEARCAYELYRQRWPKSAVDSEVRTWLERLGPGRGCAGLDPR